MMDSTPALMYVKQSASSNSLLRVSKDSFRWSLSYKMTKHLLKTSILITQFFYRSRIIYLVFLLTVVALFQGSACCSGRARRMTSGLHLFMITTVFVIVVVARIRCQNEIFAVDQTDPILNRNSQVKFMLCFKIRVEIPLRTRVVCVPLIYPSADPQRFLKGFEIVCWCLLHLPSWNRNHLIAFSACWRFLCAGVHTEIREARI